jgi:Kef-type K+ transport system membrane component KefB
MPFSFPFRPPVVLAMGTASSSLVEELGLCVLAAGFLSAIFERLHIPTIAALLVAGVVLGPVGLAKVGSSSDIETIANLGLTLLLFVIRATREAACGPLQTRLDVERMST